MAVNSGLVIAVGLILQAPAADGLRTEATRDYRAKRYAQACAKFERAAQLAPEDGAIQADLGLCLDRLGRRAEAVAASRRAVELGDERVRRNAYFNLGRMGVALSLPPQGECAAVEGNRCGKALHACTFPFKAEGNRGATAGVAVRVAADEPVARAALREANVGAHTAFDIDAGNGARSGPSLDLVLRSHSAAWCGWDLTPSGLVPTKVPGCDPQVMDDECTVVYADPRAGRLGLFCKSVEGGGARFVATELQIER